MILVRPGLQQSCDSHMVCQGERPLLPSGCCPAQAGQACQEPNGPSCDAELDLSCVHADGNAMVEGMGICKGKQRVCLII